MSSEAVRWLSCRFFLCNLGRAAAAASVGREEEKWETDYKSSQMRWRADVIATTIKDISRAACFNWLIRHATSAFGCRGGFEYM